MSDNVPIAFTGRVSGTNTGNVLLEFDADGVGTFRLLDDKRGLFVFLVSVGLNEIGLNFSGALAEDDTDGIGRVSAQGGITGDGSYQGKWETEAGYGGYFQLFPVDYVAKGNETARKAEQVYTNRKPIGLIDINKSGLVKLAELMERELKGSQTIVTVDGGTKQDMLLSDFKAQEQSIYRSRIAILYISRQDANGYGRSITIQFDDIENFIMAQSTDESWAIGVVERLRRYTRAYEIPAYFAFSKLGTSINQIIFLGVLVYLPSIASVQQRFAYVSIILALLYLISYLYKTFVPDSLILLSADRRSRVLILLGKWGSWLFGIFAASFAAFITIQFDKIWAILDLFFSNPQ